MGFDASLAHRPGEAGVGVLDGKEAGKTSFVEAVLDEIDDLKVVLRGKDAKGDLDFVVADVAWLESPLEELDMDTAEAVIRLRGLDKAAEGSANIRVGDEFLGGGWNGDVDVELAHEIKASEKRGFGGHGFIALGSEGDVDSVVKDDSVEKVEVGHC